MDTRDNEDPYAPSSRPPPRSHSPPPPFSADASPFPPPPPRRDSGDNADEDDDEPLFASASSSARTIDEGPEAAGGADQSLYAILNVPRDASVEEIRDAYKSLAVILHPDKQRTPSRKSAAESRFQAVQRAYEVLSDKNRRALYDTLGEEGLRTKLAVGQRFMTPEEIRTEFEKVSRQRREMEVENLVKSKTELTAALDATPLFAPSDQLRLPRPPLPGLPPAPVRVGLWDRITRTGFQQLHMKSSYETPLTAHTAAVISGQMVTRGNMGAGNVLGTLRTQWSPRLSTELTTTVMKPRVFAGKLNFQLDEDTFLNAYTTAQSLSSPPTLNFTFGQRLSQHVTGFFSVKSGSYAVGPWGRFAPGSGRTSFDRSSISIGFTSQPVSGRRGPSMGGLGGGGWTVQTNLGQQDLSVSLDYGLRPLGGVKARLGGSLGTMSGLSAFVSGERRVTENTRVGLALHAALAGSVTLRVRINRLSQRIIVPIVLSHEFNSGLVFWTTVLPSVGMVGLHYLLIKPRKRRRISNKLASLRAENKEYIAEKRQAAEEAVRLLADQAAKRAAREWREGGFVVLEAVYGVRTAFPPPRDGGGADGDRQRWWERVMAGERDGREEEEEEKVEGDAARDGGKEEKRKKEEEEEDKGWWDVTIPVQALVTRGQLIIPGGRSKANLLGFYDPCMGERKHLSVRYLFRGRVHEFVVDDISAVAAPLRAHQVDPGR